MVDVDREQPGGDPAMTPLARALHTPASAAKPGPLAAFELARKQFTAGERVEMRSLAATLGVDRATLYRWIGDRDQLIAEVIWSLTRPTFQEAQRQAGGAGPRRVVEVITRFAHLISSSGYLNEFLRREPERALRLLTTRAGIVQSRVVSLVEDLLISEAPEVLGAYPLPSRDLAYLIVRIGESFVYADLIIGENPAPDKVAIAVGALLGVLPNPDEHRAE
ncbi:QsdR family transcriptional regulator [Nocardia carnea]|uniref:QsdR family transcriptional regulator n=1 Tax=Nocardia carnea TaxID=37328 RepID=UPI002455EB10|nr:QsdR family transcriptional regulator [Nocardia carnea]